MYALIVIKGAKHTNQSAIVVPEHKRNAFVRSDSKKRSTCYINTLYIHALMLKHGKIENKYSDTKIIKQSHKSRYRTCAHNYKGY